MSHFVLDATKCGGCYGLLPGAWCCSQPCPGRSAYWALGLGPEQGLLRGKLCGQDDFGALPEVNLPTHLLWGGVCAVVALTALGCEVCWAETGP